MLSNRCCTCAPSGPCLDGQICLTVNNCCSPFGPISGAGVSVTRHSTGAAIGSCTTNSSGQCCVTVPGNDSYDIAVSKGGSAPHTILNVYVGCAATVNQTSCVYIPGPINACYVFTVLGCSGGGGLDGANVNVTGPKGGGGVTDSSGQYTFCTDTPGTYSYTISKTRFITQTGSFAISGTACSTPGGGNTFSLLPDTGYICCSGSTCKDPGPLTLTATGPAGSVTLTWCAGVGWWVGKTTLSGQTVGDPSCFGGIHTASVDVFVALKCLGGSGIQFSVGINCAQFAQTQLDAGTYDPGVAPNPTCTYVYTKKCINALGCGGGAAPTVSSCVPFAGSASITGAGAGGVISGTWSWSE